MFRLLAITLLFIPSPAYGQTIKLPAEIVATGKLVMVQPEFEPKALAVEFVVFGDKRKPEFASIGQAVLIATPDADDEVTIVVVALFEGNKLKSEVCKVKPPKGGTAGTPGTTPATPAVPGVDRDIPATATNLHAILVVDPAGVTQDIASLARGENAVTKALAQRKSYFYVRNATDSLVAGLQPSLQGKTLPVLVVIDGNSSPRKVLSAESFTPAGDVNQTAKRLITQIANAVGK